MARCKVAVLASCLLARPRHSSSPVHPQPSIIFKPPNAQMKRKYSRAKDRDEGVLRSRSRQRVLTESVTEAAPIVDESNSVFYKLRSAMKSGNTNLFEPLQIGLDDLVKMGHSKVSSLGLT